MINIILSLNAIALLFLGNFLFKHYKLNAKQQDQIKDLEAAVQSINKDHPILIKADLFFSRQLREINSQLISMDNQLQGLENIRENDGGYQHALRILEMGGNKDEIVESCHLSNAEAELLMNLHAYRSAMKV